MKNDIIIPMTVVNYKDNPLIRKDVEPLYVSAFPEDERPPVEMFFSTVTLKNDELLVFYDDEFIGFTNLILYKDIVYIFFLAVSNKKRSQGYGTKILSYLKKRYKDKVLTLCYEEIDNKYEDNDMRKRRKSFYYRNGFKDNEMKTCEYGVNYETCYIGSHKVIFKDYIRLYESVFGERVKSIIKEI